MNPIPKLTISALSALCCVFVVSGQSAIAASGTKVGAKSPTPKEVASGRPMTTAELRQLYSGKTWLWESGGGYMDPSGRFDAVSGRNRAQTTMTNGKWRTSSKGRMCFQGIWKTQSGKSHSETCFTHYVWGDVIYQRREPNGAWYAFKRSPVGEADEFNKIVDGNRVATLLRSQRASSDQKRK
jgi:hypothetical protein